MSQNQFFEGPEKKLELVFKAGSKNLLNEPRAFWDSLVSLAQAKILSTIETDKCKAYLLSESSLFVWENRVILITCGTTTLIKAAKHMIDTFGKDCLEEVFYERKNEYQPSLQKSSALEDMNALKEILGGKVLRFGRKDDHHVYIYNNNFGEKTSTGKVNTLELLMYGLQGEFKDSFVNKPESQKTVLKELKAILPGFELDTFFFEPEGFSFNALKGDQYATMHVTPQGSENYLSFEMDQINLAESEETVSKLVKLCKPISYDIILFTAEEENVGLHRAPYEVKQISKCSTDSGYEVLYSHFYDKQNIYIEPFNI
jgi:S-adenosylmethionine decarboxylase